MKCFECRGTGAACPDCWLCRGRRDVHWRRAVNQGWAKGDLDLYPGTDYVTCPRDECRGDGCNVCGGDGSVRRGRFQIEVTRVLVFGLKQRIPPLLERRDLTPGQVARIRGPRRFQYANMQTKVYDHERLLSAQAARYCREKNWGNRWQVLAFGDEFHLTPAGEVEATRRYPHWLNWLSSTSLRHWMEWMEEEEPRYDSYWNPPPVDHISPARWADDGGRHA